MAVQWEFMNSSSPQSCVFLPHLLFTGDKRGVRFASPAAGGVSIRVLSVVKGFGIGVTGGFLLAVCEATRAQGREQGCLSVTPGTSYPAWEPRLLPFPYSFQSPISICAIY